MEQRVANELAARSALRVLAGITKPISRWRIELRFDDVMNRAFKRQTQGSGRSEGALLGWQLHPGSLVHKQLGDRAWPLLTARGGP